MAIVDTWKQAAVAVTVVIAPPCVDPIACPEPVDPVSNAMEIVAQMLRSRQQGLEHLRNRPALEASSTAVSDLTVGLPPLEIALSGSVVNPGDALRS